MAESRKIDIEVRIQGADQAATVMGGLNSKLDETSRSADTAGTSVASVNDHLVAGGRKWGEFAGAIGSVGTVFAGTNPAIGQAGALIGAVGTASTAATGAMGPLGVVLAVVSTAYGVYQIAAQNARRETEQMAAAAEAAEGRIRSLGSAMSSDARRGAAGLGLSGVDEASAELERLQERRAGIIADRFGTVVREMTASQAAEFERVASQGVSDESRTRAREVMAARERLLEVEREIEGAREGQRRAAEGDRVASAGQAELDAAAEMRAQVQRERDERDARRSRGGRSAGPSARDTAREESLALKERLNTALLQQQEYRDQLAADEAADTAARTLAMLENEEFAADQRQQSREAEKASRQDAHDDQMRLLEEQEAAQREAIESLRNDSMPLLSGAVNGLTDALSSVIAGTKSADVAFQGMLSSFLEMIAQQAALEAAKEFAAAIGSFASQSYGAAALHLAAGAAWTGVAVAAGAASIATAPAAASAPASPQQGGGDSGGGGSSYTFNINGPVLSAGSRANLGREISSITDEGSRRFGRTG